MGLRQMLGQAVWRWEECRMGRSYHRHEGRKPTMAEVRRWERQAARRYNRGAGKAPSGREICERHEEAQRRQKEEGIYIGPSYCARIQISCEGKGQA